MRHRPRVTALPIALVAVVLTAGCGGHAPRPTLASRPSLSASATGEDARGDNVPVADDQPGTSGGAKRADGGSHPASGAGAVVAPATSLSILPGTYRYAVTGTASDLFGGTQPLPPAANLLVDASVGASQRQVLTESDQITDELLHVQPDGVYLARLRLSASRATKEFSFEPPMLLLPATASPGKSWSATATSTDGATTLRATLDYVRSEVVTVGADAVPALVIHAVLVATGDVSLRTDRVFWGSPLYRLVLRQEETGDGRYGFVTFHSHSTAVLASVHPI